MRTITTRIMGVVAMALFAIGSADPIQMACCFNPGNEVKMACCKHLPMACCRPHPNGPKHHMA